MEITLGDNVVLPCPLIGFALRRVSHCASCEHFKGIAQATVNGKPVVSGDIDDYQIICGRPITRRLQRIAE